MPRSVAVWVASNGDLPPRCREMLAMPESPLKASGRVSVNAIGVAPLSVPASRARKPERKSRVRLHGLSQLDAVLGLEMAAGQIVGAGKRDEHAPGRC